jgi:hypothetical protein
MRKRLLFAFAIGGLAIASAKSYSIDLFQPALLGDTQLAPGHYSVDVTEQKAVVRNGKVHGEAPVKVQMMDQKYPTTTVLFNNGDGKMHIQEIHVGGTTTKLVFAE